MKRSICILTGIVFFAVVQTILGQASDLVAWWQAEGNARDSVGNNNGTLLGGAGYGPGEVGQAFRFDGVDDGVDLGNVADLDYSAASSFTWEARVNYRGLTAQGAQFVLATNYACSPTAQWLVILNSGADAGKVVFGVRDANDVASTVTTPFPLSLNTWYHLTAVREVTAAGKFIHLYVDCELVASAPDITTATLASNVSDFIGRRFLCPDPSTFNGLIDEVRLYGRALTPEEIAQGSCSDTDGDGLADGDDNCPTIPNSDQSDLDADGIGDACDSDNDNDGVLDGQDNCPGVANSNQTDFDGDGFGDACESDDDGDGVLDAVDACPGTSPGQVVNADGCTIAALCPCENSWRSHGAYVSCVTRAAQAFAAAGLITETQKGAIDSEAGLSDCGNRR